MTISRRTLHRLQGSASQPIPVTQFFPGLTVHPSEDGRTEVWQHGDEGERVVGNCEPERIEGVGPFCGRIERGDRWRVERLRSLELERRFVPVDSYFATLEKGDRVDNKPNTNGTGGSRRNFASNALQRALWAEHKLQKIAPDAPETAGARERAIVREAVESLHQWCSDQIRFRPYFHNPWKVTGDQYSKRDVNLGTPKAFRLGGGKVVHPEREGHWTSGDIAHGDYAISAAAAALGDPLGVITAALQWRAFLCEAPPDTTSWMGQPRGIGHLLAWDALAHSLGFGTEPEFVQRFCAGLTPSAAIAGHVAKLRDDPRYGFWARYTKAGAPSAQTLPDLGNGHLRGVYSWQSGIGAFGIVRALETQAVFGELLSEKDAEWLRRVGQDVVARIEECALGQAGLSRSYGTDVFDTRAKAEEVLRQAEAQGKAGDLEIHEVAELRFQTTDFVQPAGYLLRTRPRAQDFEIVAAPAAWLLGTKCKSVRGFLACMRQGHEPVSCIAMPLIAKLEQEL